jgi:Flp pilus assembly protein TadG
MIAFGKYLLTAHIVQQAANDAARAAIAGLDEGERETIARRTVDHVLAAGGVLEPGHASISSDEQGGMMVINVAYDISRDPLMHLPLAPSPGNTVVSQAVIVLSEL